MKISRAKRGAKKKTGAREASGELKFYKIIEPALENFELELSSARAE